MSSKRATPEQTIEALLKSERNTLPLSKLFVQHRDEDDRGCPGPLSKFVRAHHRQALLQYLLLHAHVAAGPDFSTARDSRIWARALGIPREAVSRNWRWLEERKLIERSRAG